LVEEMRRRSRGCMGRIVAILEVEGEGKYAVVEAAMISVREARRVGRGCGGALRLVKSGRYPRDAGSICILCMGLELRLKMGLGTIALLDPILNATEERDEQEETAKNEKSPCAAMYR
jgi:hypothetical protein